MRAVSGPTERVVVVGAGLAGLAAAAHLAGRGRAVTVLEAGEGPGGKMGALDLDGYRLDTGPTVLTMPEVLDETFAAAGSHTAAELELVELDPVYRAAFADGSSLDVHTDPDRMAEAVREFAGPADAAGYLRLRGWLRQLYDAEFDRFIAANMDSPLSLLTPALARLVAMGAFGRLDAAVGRFIADERLRRVFSFQSLYTGLAPHRALALYAVIAYMDTVAGVYFPRGGMRAVPAALAGAAERAGVAFRYGTRATRLERAGRRVAAVHTDTGARLACDAVVLATELPEAYRLLARSPRRPVRLRPAPSAVVAHLGARAGMPELAHHTLSFGAAWHGTFEEIISRGELMSDPSLLITRPTATDGGLAPAGRQLISVLAPAPNLERSVRDWDRMGQSYADQILRLVERRHVPGLCDSGEARHVITPADWSRHGAVAGTPFSYAHTFGQTGPFRPQNMPRGAGNVVLAGAGTVPGVGIPPVLLSGRLAADRITGTAGHPRSRTVDLGGTGGR